MTTPTSETTAPAAAGATTPTRGYTLCSVGAGSAYNQMQAAVFTASQENGLPAGYTAFLPLAGAGAVAAYNSTTGDADVYAVPAAGQGFGASSGSQSPGAGFDALLPFTLGGQPMALGYSSSSGTVQFFGVSGTTLTARNTFAAGSGMTTVLPFLDWDGSTAGGTYLLCYDMNSGAVAIYQLTASGGGVQATKAWSPSEPWAEGWTRFGLFQYGPENFFIKTNVKYGTVFIDHIMDEPSQGTHPAQEHLPLPLDLTAVATFTLLGDPCFATYLANSGAATFNRFRGDLTGWTEGAQATAVTGGSLAVSLPSASSGGSAATLLFY